jgi:CxxC motif-containing protein
VEYAKSEYTFPKRTITTTVAIEGANIKRLAAISSSAVPKEALSQCLEYLYGIVVKAPVKMGDVIVKDLLGTGADIVAARSIYASNKSEESR